ncbi:MAG TPA: exonuclease domain-containing protein [Armatimonadota bacterium]|jgi:DNA polymerase III epsilon subunit family exonuclease
MFTISPQTRIVALDLETTGLSADRHRIVEMAAVCWQNGQETGHFEALVHPGCPMPHGVIRVHGITDAMVQDKPRVHEVLPAFLEFCSADIVLAHNAPFDVRFLNAECARMGIAPFAIPVTDTCTLARQRLSACPNFKLETLKAALGLGHGQEHRALSDARDCLQIFLRCLLREPPTLLPVSPPSLPEKFTPLREALLCGGTAVIEYQDMRGRVTRREIRPLVIDVTTVEAHCMLRNDKRHFSLDRIQRVWRGDVLPTAAAAPTTAAPR